MSDLRRASIFFLIGEHINVEQLRIVGADDLSGVQPRDKISRLLVTEVDGDGVRLRFSKPSLKCCRVVGRVVAKQLSVYCGAEGLVLAVDLHRVG